MLLLLLLRAFHSLAPCLVAAWLVLYHYVESHYVAKSPAASPLLKNVGCCVSEMLPAVDIVSIAEGWAAVPVIAMFGLLGVPDIAAGGALVVNSCFYSVAVPLSDVLASARGVVVASASR